MLENQLGSRMLLLNPLQRPRRGNPR
jgi:hypothetical protein